MITSSFRPASSRRLTGVAVALVALAATYILLPVEAAAAQLGTDVVAEPDRGVLTVRAASLKANAITIVRQGDQLIVSDAGDFIGISNCPRIDQKRVSCSMRGLWDVQVLAGDFDDEIVFDAVDDFELMVGTLSGGTGDDTLSLGPSAGRGVLLGGPGNDRLSGGTAADRMIGGEGADRFAGGDGIDTADYSDRSVHVRVSIGLQLPDGEQGENDNVLDDVENVIGGTGPDSLQGNGLDNQLWGGSGEDVLNGGPGDDVLSGNGGEDRLNGEEGRDDLFGGDGNDTLDGGLGTDQDLFDGGTGSDVASYAFRQDSLIVDNDGASDDGSGSEGDNVKPNVERIRGGNGNDQLSVVAPGSTPEINVLEGGQGDDRLDVRDGGPRDVVDGGLGQDACFIDPTDTPRLACELAQ
ncbi:calcium-binding protein [Kribbella catacumbae]|uniref:calcium-binding protein n=1 Tax=Kribbella catacumbae TaxID=460086 RepID=UPI001ED98F15|nr:calcium-binding protein [Kribbella catacumbae]